MTVQLPCDVWVRILEYARPAEVSLPVYPNYWTPSWLAEAHLASAALRRACGQSLKLALLFRNENMLRELRNQKSTAQSYQRYIHRYEAVVQYLADEEEDATPEPFFEVYTPRDLERSPRIVSYFHEWASVL
jgi:molybdopterin-guanine dinucleotide biosynthesis protein A